MDILDLPYRLRVVIWEVPTWVTSDPAKQIEYDRAKVRGIVKAIVTELGITEEMVEVVREMASDCLGDCGDHEYAGHGLDAATALATLMEVADD